MEYKKYTYRNRLPEVGDLIIKGYGRVIYKVLSASRWGLKLSDKHGKISYYSYCFDYHYQLVSNHIQPETKGEEKMIKLYNIKGTDDYCTFLATDSKGQWVVEMKGSSEVKSVAPDALEEVVPYTVDVVFMDNYKSGSKRYAYTSKEGLYNEGDFLILDNSLAKVVAVGTKNSKATKELNALRLITEKVG